MSLATITKTVFLFLLVIPMVSAFNCHYFEGVERDNCFEIANSGLSEEEKDKLYADLLYGSSPYADFKAVRDWNLAQDIAKTETAKTSAGQFVKNAWLDQLAIMPALIEGNTLYVPGEIEILTGFGYDISIPPDYYSGGYPRTSQGDCRREYSVRSRTAKTEVLVNGKVQGSGTLVTAEISKDSVIESRLSVDVSVEIDHYEWDSWCCRRDEDGCVKRCHECEFDHHETRTDRIRLSDTVSVKLHNIIPEIVLEINDEYYGTTKGKVTASNYSSFELQFEDSKLKRTANLYEAVLDAKPIYIATLKAKPYESQSIKNLYLENNTFYVKNTGDCRVVSKSHFNTFEQECEFIINPDNETKEFELQEFGGDVYFAFGLCIFLFVNYVIYKVILHYWGRLG
jgi:hypothetical protein